MADSDPTQPGGQEDERKTLEEQIADRVNAAQAADLTPLGEEDAEVAAPTDDDEPETKAEIAEPVAVVASIEAAPATPRMMSIVVDGQTIEVEESRILEAGKRTLQKDQAADRRLQEATQLRKQADEELRRLQNQSRPPEQGAATSEPQRNEPAISSETLDVLLENKLYNRDAQKAAAKFKEDFPEIADDPHLMNMAGTLEQQRMATVAALGESYGDPFEAYRKHGEAIRTWMAKFKPAVEPPPQDKIDRKRTITAVPAANAKAPAPEEPRAMTMSEVIQQERKARMGRPINQRSH